MYHLDQLIAESVRTHGHLCPGQVIGVRMSLLGLYSIGIEAPCGHDKKNIIVFVETDRCAVDAIQSVTGCSLGRRTLKFLDYGKMAATFLNVQTGRSVRIIAREEAREKAARLSNGSGERYNAQIEAYKIMADHELFELMDVEVSLPSGDLPGKTSRRIQCDKCGEYIQGMKNVNQNGSSLCKPCATGAYYEIKEVHSLNKVKL
jgi:formylmethanofuran dehydrogenase subunit E